MGVDSQIEKLAALEHEQWAHWTKYMFTVLAPLLGTVRMVGAPEYDAALTAIERWRRQIETPYAELSETEKESDREWARKVATITNEAVTEALDAYKAALRARLQRVEGEGAGFYASSDQMSGYELAISRAIDALDEAD